MKRIVSILLLLMLLIPVSLADQPAAPLDAKVEIKLDQYIAEYALTEECKAVLVEYLPDVNSFDKMEREGTNAYSLIMGDGTKYYMIVSINGEPVSLMSSEKDYDARTRYYDKYEMEKQQKAEANVSYIGNANSLKLHYPSCESVRKMKEKNKVEFSSKEEALNQGYAACKQCMP